MGWGRLPRRQPFTDTSQTRLLLLITCASCLFRHETLVRASCRLQSQVRTSNLHSNSIHSSWFPAAAHAMPLSVSASSRQSFHPNQVSIAKQPISHPCRPPLSTFSLPSCLHVLRSGQSPTNSPCCRQRTQGSQTQVASLWLRSTCVHNQIQGAGRLPLTCLGSVLPSNLLLCCQVIGHGNDDAALPSWRRRLWNLVSSTSCVSARMDFPTSAPLEKSSDPKWPSVLWTLLTSVNVNTMPQRAKQTIAFFGLRMAITSVADRPCRLLFEQCFLLAHVCSPDSYDVVCLTTCHLRRVFTEDGSETEILTRFPGVWQMTLALSCYVMTALPISCGHTCRLCAAG